MLVIILHMLALLSFCLSSSRCLMPFSTFTVIITFVFQPRKFVNNNYILGFLAIKDQRNPSFWQVDAIWLAVILGCIHFLVNTSSFLVVDYVISLFSNVTKSFIFLHLFYQKSNHGLTLLPNCASLSFVIFVFNVISESYANDSALMRTDGCLHVHKTENILSKLTRNTNFITTLLYLGNNQTSSFVVTNKYK